jgi:threonine/homoserine/homoserine lactone efflux protein
MGTFGVVGTASLRQTYAAGDDKSGPAVRAAANRPGCRHLILIEIKVSPAVKPHAALMNELILFTLGALALLATPGPTNTLLATSGAVRGFRPSLPLLLGEASGYLAAILVLRTIAAPVMADQTRVAQILSGLVCAYLLFLSWKLWRRSAAPLQSEAAVSLGSVFVTTLLNPKALVFAYLLLPAGQIGDLTAWLIALLAMIALCGSGWIAIGAAILNRSQRRADIGYRAGAIALFILAMALGTRASGMA